VPALRSRLQRRLEPALSAIKGRAAAWGAGAAARVREWAPLRALRESRPELAAQREERAAMSEEEKEAEARRLGETLLRAAEERLARRRDEAAAAPPRAEPQWVARLRTAVLGDYWERRKAARTQQQQQQQQQQQPQQQPPDATSRAP
jgi:hypothetical protein